MDTEKLKKAQEIESKMDDIKYDLGRIKMGGTFRIDNERWGQFKRPLSEPLIEKYKEILKEELRNLTEEFNKL